MSRPFTRRAVTGAGLAGLAAASATSTAGLGAALSAAADATAAPAAGSAAGAEVVTALRCTNQAPRSGAIGLTLVEVASMLVSVA